MTGAAAQRQFDEGRQFERNRIYEILVKYYRTGAASDLIEALEEIFTYTQPIDWLDI
jgi:hypothetical protein